MSMEANEKINQGKAEIKKTVADLTDDQQAQDQAEGEETRSKAAEKVADLRDKAKEKTDELIGKVKNK